MLAKDIMRSRVITVTPQMTVKEVARLFCDRRITGAPVVGPGGRVVGVVSQTDLVRQERESSPREVPVYHQEAEERAGPGGFHYEDPDYSRVEQVMTPWAISFGEDTPVVELARQMLAKRIHRVIITKGGRLCGIVTSTDMLRALLAMSQKAKPERARASSPRRGNTPP